MCILTFRLDQVIAHPKIDQRIEKIIIFINLFEK